MNTNNSGDCERYLNTEVKIDFETAMSNRIAGEILNNEELKNNYVRILAIATLKVEEALRHEREFYK